jgi:cyclopropane-fatty-acyl-phospholipid synthase
MNLIPTSALIARWYNALSRLEYGTLHFVSPAGERASFKGLNAGPEAEFAISSWDVIRRMVARGDIAMGEDYIEGLWTTPAIEPLFSLFLLNLDALDGFANGNIMHKSLLAMHNQLVRRNSKRGSSRNIRAHYDVGNAFYSLWLDKTMTYSSALDTSATTPLEQAQTNKYQRILGRIEQQNASVLEIGSGWGGFAEQAAGSNHQITGLTVSPAQHEFSRNRLGSAADIRLQDYRDVRGTFDTIVSIEMFEAVGERYWPVYFNQLRERMNRGGKAIIQTITIRDDLFDAYRTRSDFVRHYVFPGGMLPSFKRFQEEANKANLKVTDSHFFGHDYAHTLQVWGERLIAKRSEILALGYDEKFIRNWEYYLGMCAAAFSIGRTDVAQVELKHA